MPWTAACVGLRAAVDRARSRRRAHRALARELADYATPAELAALIAGRGHGDGQVAELQARQARLGMLRDSNPPFWPPPPAP